LFEQVHSLLRRPPRAPGTLFSLFLLSFHFPLFLFLFFKSRRDFPILLSTRSTAENERKKKERAHTKRKAPTKLKKKNRETEDPIEQKKKREQETKAPKRPKRTKRTKALSAYIHTYIHIHTYVEPIKSRRNRCTASASKQEACAAQRHQARLLLSLPLHALASQPATSTPASIHSYAPPLPGIDRETAKGRERERERERVRQASTWLLHRRRGRTLPSCPSTPRADRGFFRLQGGTACVWAHSPRICPRGL